MPRLDEAFDEAFPVAERAPVPVAPAGQPVGMFGIKTDDSLGTALLKWLGPAPSDLVTSGTDTLGSAVQGAQGLLRGEEGGLLDEVGMTLLEPGKANQRLAEADPGRKYRGQGVVKAIGSTLPILGVDLVTGPAGGYVLSGLTSAGEAAERARAKGVGETGVQLAALAGGTTGFLIERTFGASGKITDRLSDGVLKPGYRGLVQFLERIWDEGALAKEAGGEGVEEALQGLTQDIIQRSYDPNQDVVSWDSALRRANEFGYGAAAAGIMSGVASGSGLHPISLPSGISSDPQRGSFPIGRPRKGAVARRTVKDRTEYQNSVPWKDVPEENIWKRVGEIGGPGEGVPMPPIGDAATGTGQTLTVPSKNIRHTTMTETRVYKRLTLHKIDMGPTSEHADVLRSRRAGWAITENATGRELLRWGISDTADARFITDIAATKVLLALQRMPKELLQSDRAVNETANFWLKHAQGEATPDDIPQWWMDQRAGVVQPHPVEKTIERIQAGEPVRPGQLEAFYADNEVPEGKTQDGDAIPKAGQLEQFTTAKGSIYRVHEDGTTTRNKAARLDVGHENDSGLKPRSEATFYVDEAGADALGLIQTQGASGHRVIAELPDGRWGVRYTSGKDSGKFERRSVATVDRVPKVGLTPVEIWDGGRRVHFGNKITEVRHSGTTLEGQPYITPAVEDTDPDFQMRGGSDAEVDLPVPMTIRDEFAAATADPDMGPGAMNYEGAVEEVAAREAQNVRDAAGKAPARPTPSGIPERSVTTGEQSFTEDAKLSGNSWYYQMLRAPRLFEMLDGWKKNGPLYQRFYAAKTNAWINFKRMTTGWQLQHSKWIDQVSKGDKAWWSREMDTRHKLPSGKEISGGELAGLAMAVHDKSAARKMMQDGILTPDKRPVGTVTNEDLKYVGENLTAGQRQMIEKVRADWRWVYPRLKQTAERLLGRALPDLGPDYFHNIGSGERSESMGLEEMLQSAFGEAVSNEIADKLSKTPVKQRAPNAHQQIIVDLPTVHYAYMHNALWFITNAESSMDLRAIAQDRNFRNAVDEVHGTGARAKAGSGRPVDAMTAIDDFVEATSRPGLESTGHDTMTWMRTHAAVGMMAFKVGVAGKQLASLSTAAAEYGNVSAILQGIRQVSGAFMKTGSWTNPTTQFAEEICPEIKYQNIDPAIEAIKTEQTSRAKRPVVRKFLKGQRKLIDAGMAMATEVARHVSASVAIGVYNAEMAKNGGDHVLAAAEARRVVLTTQTQSAPKDLAPWMRQPSEMARAVSVFTNDASQSVNMTATMKGRYDKGLIGKGDLAKFAVLQYVLPGALIAAIDAAGNPDWDDWAQAAGKQVLGGIPYIGNMVGSLFYAAEKGFSGDSLGQAADQSLITYAPARRALVGAGGIVKDVAKGKTPSMTQGANFVGGTLSAFGLPGDQVRILMNAAEELKNNPAMHPAEFVRSVLFSRYARRNGVMFGSPPRTSKKSSPYSYKYKPPTYKYSSKLDQMFGR